MANYDEKSHWLDEHFSPTRVRFRDDLEQQSLDSDDEDRTVLPLSTPPQKKPKKSTAYLDGLRGVAALCVFTQHLIGGGEHQLGFGANGKHIFISFPFIRIFYSGGAAAVAVFFVLSGFVISQSAVRLFRDGQRQQSVRSLISSVVRRPVRLYLPCFAVALVIALLMQLPNKIYPDVPWSIRQESLGAELVHWFKECLTYFNPFQHHSWLTGKFSYNTVMWTIPVELKGSMLVYALTVICCFGLASPLWSVGFLSVAVVALLQLGWWSGGLFTAGLLMSIVDLYALDTMHFFRYFSPRVGKLLVHLIFILSYYLLCQPVWDGRPEVSLDTPGWYILTRCIPSTYDKDTYYRFWQAYGAIFFVYATLHLHWLQRIFQTRPIQYLGKVSFMFYLVHVPLFHFISDRLVRALGKTEWITESQWWDNKLYVPDVGPRGFSLRWTIDWTVMLVICLGVADVATRFIDEPVVRLGKRFTRKLGLA